MALPNQDQGSSLWPLLQLLRWAATSLLRSPALWLWFALTALAWPVLTRFARIGVTTDSGTSQGTLYEIAFIGLELGGLAGLALLDRNRSLFLRTARPRRLIAEFLGLLGACGLYLGAGLLVPFLWEARQSRPIPTGLFPGLLLGGIQLVAVALCLLHLPLGPWARRLLLPFGTWLLPALVSLEGPLGQWIHRVLGIASRLSPDGALTPGRVGSDSLTYATSLPLLGWILLAWLTIPSRPVEHALRDPR